MMTNVPTEVSFVFSDPSHLSPPLVLDSDASDADGFLLRLSPSLSALQHALALHLPSFFPSLSPSSSSYHCALTSPFSLSHSGGILHLSTSTFHAHLTPLLSPPLPLRHLLTPFICLPPPPPHHHHKLRLPLPFLFSSFSHTRLRRLVQTHAALHTLMLIGTQGRSAHSLSKDGVRKARRCDRQAS